MHASPRGVDERSFVVNSEDLRAQIVGLMLNGDEAGNSFDAAADIFGTRRDGCGHKRGGAMASQCLRHRAQGLGCAFHYIVTSSAVNVHIHEARNGGQVSCPDFLGAGWKGHALAGSESFDYAFSNENSSIRNFNGRREGTCGVQQNRGHGGEHRNGNSGHRKTGDGLSPSVPGDLAVGDYFFFAAISMLATFSVSPSMLPLRVT